MTARNDPQQHRKEGTCFTGAYNQPAVATLVERPTGYVMLVKLPADHTAGSVCDGLIRTMATLPAHLRGSLAWDQCAEMALHRSFGTAAETDVCFWDAATAGSADSTRTL